jgi:hypothetical protein
MSTDVLLLGDYCLTHEVLNFLFASLIIIGTTAVDNTKDV